jgi:hypothetical protein
MTQVSTQNATEIKSADRVEFLARRLHEVMLAENLCAVDVLAVCAMLQALALVNTPAEIRQEAFERIHFHTSGLVSAMLKRERLHS